MKPSQIASLVVAALLAGFGVVGKFSELFSSATVAWVAFGVGVSGALATRLLPPVATVKIPAHWGKVLSQLVGAVLAVGAVAAPMLPQLPGVTLGALRWFTFAMATAAAISTVILPNEKRPMGEAAAFLSRAAIVLFLTLPLAACGAQFRQLDHDHNIADQHSAKTQKMATKDARGRLVKMRENCDAACREIEIKGVEHDLDIVDGQADQALGAPVTP